MMKASNLQLSIGTGGGTLLSVLGSIGMHDVLKTAVLAAIGAAVSFAASWALQKMWGRKR
ncbi:hypothetical protein [Parapedobacter sp. 2B3]|uniref:hypothetical protein n=1 Tax=Parapedobacter sp. 2B3 TaxID=3342381 RepID=UPI0035B69BC9